MKSTTTATANTWTFAPTSATVNGRTFDASYSLARSGDVYVFTSLRAADGTDMPVRIHVTAQMPMHADAVAAAKAAAAARAAAKAHKAADAAPDVAAAPAQDKIAPAQDKTAPAQDAPKPAKTRKAAPVKAADAAPVAAAAPTQDKPAPAQDAPKPAKARKPKAAPVVAAKPAAAPAQEKLAPAQGKAWIGTAIEGQGWRIAFDEQTQRTRVSFTGDPTAAQKAAVEQAGFFWSSVLKTWNKKLTCKARRAALELATTLAALA